MLMARIFSGRTVFAICGIVFLACLVYRVLLLFFPHPDIGGVEGNVVYFIQRLLDGHSLYTDPAKTPYAIAQYTPLYYYLVAAVAKAAGLRADDVYTVFLANRVVSLLLNLGLLIVICRLCKHVFNLSARKSLVAAFTSFIFLSITSFGRPDSLYHLLSLSAIFYLLKAGAKAEGISYTSIALSAMFAVLALFSKQTGIVLPLITGFWFLWNRNYKAVLLYTGVYTGLTAAFLLLISQTMGLHFFYSNTVQGINNGVSITWYLFNFLKPLFWGINILLPFAFLLLLVLFRSDQRKLYRLAGYLLISLFVLLNGTGLKLGSVPGYLTEWWIMLFILLAAYWPVLTRAFAVINKYIPAGLAIVVLVAKLITLVPSLGEKIKALGSPALMDNYNREQATAYKIIERLSPGEQYVVFTNLYTPDSYMSNFLFRHAVMPQLEIVTMSAYPQQKYDYADLHNRLQDGSIGWMLKKEKETTYRFYDIPLDKYVLADSLNNFYLYRYKP